MDQSRFDKNDATRFDKDLGIPVVYRNDRVSNFEPSVQVSASRVVDGYLSGRQRGIFVMGPAGSGKTALIWSVIRELFLRGAIDYADRPVFRTHFKLITDLRYCVENPGDSRTFPRWAKVMTLDDLGRGHDDASGWNLALLDEFVDERWQHEMPLFVSTNKTPEEVRSWAGYERIIDRLTDPDQVEVIQLLAPNDRSFRRRDGLR